MFTALMPSYAELITSGAQLLLLIIGFKIGTETGWQIALGLIAITSLIAWYSVLRRLRAITGTPTSRIVSAAQGYVELMGKGRYHSAGQMLSKLSALPCLWYRYSIEEEISTNKWKIIDKGECDEPFLLDDGSGICNVNPTGAEILTSHKDVWREAKYRYTEWKLIEGDPIYALGDFKTVGGSSVERTLNDEMKEVLQEWKFDMPKLNQQFDLNQDGTLDPQEWALARSAARREAEKRLVLAQTEADTNHLVQPNDGRLFLISNRGPENLTRRYTIWAWINLAIFFGAIGSLVWVFDQGGV